jgi:hypothetical protein
MSDESWRSALHAELTAGRAGKRQPQPYDTRRWKDRRAALKDGAGCVLCLRFGLHEPATIADHIQPVTNGGAFEGDLQPVCANCHKLKRLIEGRWRRGELPVSELNLAVSREGARLRAAAFGVGVDGMPICPWRNNDDFGSGRSGR